MIMRVTERGPATEADMLTLRRKLNWMEKNGTARDALDVARTALGVCRRIHGSAHPRTAELLSRVALCLESMENHEEALRFHEKAVRVAGQALGEADPEVTCYLDNLACLLGRLGRREARDEVRARIQRIHAERLAADDVLVIGMLYNVGIADPQCDERETAEAVAQRVVNAAEAMYVAGQEAATALAGVAREFAHEGCHNVAERLFRQALRRARENARAASDLLSVILHGLAAAHLEQGDHLHARMYFRQAVDLRERATRRAVA